MPPDPLSAAFDSPANATPLLDRWGLDKFLAEVEVSKCCESLGVPLAIVRPSVIINDRTTGRASTFTHLNALVEVVSRLQRRHGIQDGEVVSERIRLLADPQARPNLAPIDSILPGLLRVCTTASAVGAAYHLCHPNPQSNLEIVALVCEAFGVKEKLGIDYVTSLHKPVSTTEEMISRSLKVYGPYLNSRCDFDVTNSRSLLKDYDTHFSPLTVDFLNRIIAFQRGHRGGESGD